MPSRPPRSCALSFLGEQRVELAAFLERVELVAAADMRCADEDLRDRGASVGARDHLLAHLRIRRDVDLAEFHALAREQLLCPMAIGAILLRIDFDRSHNDALILSEAYLYQTLIWTSAPDRQPWRRPARRHWRRRRAGAPARNPRPSPRRSARRR